MAGDRQRRRERERGREREGEEETERDRERITHSGTGDKMHACSVHPLPFLRFPSFYHHVGLSWATSSPSAQASCHGMCRVCLRVCASPFTYFVDAVARSCTNLHTQTHPLTQPPNTPTPTHTYTHPPTQPPTPTHTPHPHFLPPPTHTQGVDDAGVGELQHHVLLDALGIPGTCMLYIYI
jgi:hypothetical protein